ncbi:unnamed protein product [Ceratitis capitata]|uniref:(Mediterranean fruit fly) hypothetical protein n=1 Tax=Ceratitis capitata TaxID=7213 RepID=A0A811UV92_CERCA|nr:unnamed protein product [Ceratitis capitata]
MATKMAVPLAPTAETENCLQCRLCHKYHPLRMCGAFRAMKPPQRLVVARAQGYCMNCLALTHTTGECDSPSSCKRCHKAHHTLMHQDAAVKCKPATRAAHQVVASKKSAAPPRVNPASRYTGLQPVIKRAKQRAPTTKKRRSQPKHRRAAATPVPAPAGRPRETKMRTITRTATGLQMPAFCNRAARGAIGDAIRALQTLQDALGNASLQSGEYV